jgi:steroid delta-isomerase-like uncharacterized protein
MAPDRPTWLTTYFEAWSSHDPERVASCTTEDVVMDDKALGERVVGHDAVRAMVTAMTQEFSTDFRMDPGELVVTTDGTWAAEWVLSGTNDREDRQRGLPATGRRFRIEGLSIGRLRDGRIAEERLYWNLAGYLQQVGLMPAAPAPATA